VRYDLAGRRKGKVNGHHARRREKKTEESPRGKKTRTNSTYHQAKERREAAKSWGKRKRKE